MRSQHHCSSLKLRKHQLRVLLGLEPSIASILRSHLLPNTDELLPFDELVDTLSNTRLAPCYIILSSSTKAIVIEKDLLDASIRSRSDFIACTNNDFVSPPSKLRSWLLRELSPVSKEWVLAESVNRWDCMQIRWDRLVKKERKRLRKAGWKGKDGRKLGDLKVAVREKTLRRWVQTYPTMNGLSHFVCVVDPGTGTVRWIVGKSMWDNVEEGEVE
jgi:hypothetical protein